MDTERTDHPTCPYCGYAERDAWEINFGIGLDGDTEISCSNCDHDYFARRIVDVCYTTMPLSPNKSSTP